MRPPFAALRLSLLVVTTLPRLAASTWIGEGDLMDWEDAANWSGGTLPGAGETIVVRPPRWVETLRLGGGDSAGPLRVVIESDQRLSLVLTEGTTLESLASTTGGHHRLEGAALGGEGSWNLATFSSVRVDNFAPWSRVELSGGGGVLVVGPQDATGVTPVSIVARSGVVHLDDELGPSHDGIELTLAGGQAAFSWDVGRIGSLRLEDGHTWTEGWSRMQVQRLEVAGDLPRDMRALPRIEAEVAEFRIPGELVLGDNLSAGLVVAEVAELGLSGLEHGFALRLESGRVADGSLAGNVRVLSGTLACATSGTVEVLGGSLTGEGLSVAGTLRVEASVIAGDVAVSGGVVVGGGMSAWGGAMELGEGAGLLWMPEASEETVVGLTGAWSLVGGNLLMVGETDWSSPYWDTDRQVRLVDVWEGGSLSGTLVLAEGTKGEEGAWALSQADDGDLMLAWTALGAAAVPEGSALPLGAAALLAALSGRRRRARSR